MLRKKEKQESIAHSAVGMSYQWRYIVRIGKLLEVPEQESLRIAQSICDMPLDMASREHPDVIIIRRTWEKIWEYRGGNMSCNAPDAGEVSFMRIKDPVIRVMAALRYVDRIPYEVLATVWKKYTQQHIMQSIHEAVYQIYRAQESHTLMQKNFVRLFQLIDANVTITQLMQMRIPLPQESIVEVWSLYDSLIQSAYISPRTAPHEEYGVAPALMAPQEQTTVRESNAGESHRNRERGMRPLVRIGIMLVATFLVGGLVIAILARFENDAVHQAQEVSVQNQTQEKKAVTTNNDRSLQEVIRSLRAHIETAKGDANIDILRDSIAIDTIKREIAFAKDIVSKESR